MSLFYCVSCDEKRQKKKEKHKRYELYLKALELMKEYRETPWITSSDEGIDLIISSFRHQFNITKEK